MTIVPPSGSQGTPPRGLPPETEWRNGQMLRATVERGAERVGDTALLRVGRRQLPVNPQIPLARGMELLVQVVREQQTMALKLLELPRPVETKPPPRLVEQFQSQIRQLAPRQESPTRLMAVLQTIARAPQSLNIPEPVRQLAREAIRSLPDSGQVQDPATLRRAVNAALTPTGSPAPGSPSTRAEATGGLSLLVTRLIDLLAGTHGRPAVTQGVQPGLPTRLGPPQATTRWAPQILAQLSGSQLLVELLSAARGTQSRQALQQLAGLEVAASSAGDARWHVELPIRFGDAVDLLSLVIERENRRDPDGKRESAWQATLALSLPDLGGIQARVALVRDQIAIDFHIEEQPTLQQVEREMPRLQEALAGRDLTISQITARLGSTDRPEQANSQRLVDIKA